MTNAEALGSMRWGDISNVLEAVEVGPAYQLEQLREASVDELIASLLTIYPEIEGGAEGEHLHPSFYRDQVQLAETRGDRDRLVLIARARQKSESAEDDSTRNAAPTNRSCAGPIVGVLSLEKRPPCLHIIGRLGAVDPAHRGSAIGFLGPMLLETFGRKLGATLAWYYATLRSKHQQAIAERRGFRLVGIMPANDLKRDTSGEPYWVCEALYAKVLREASVRFPESDALTTQTQALFELIGFRR